MKGAIPIAALLWLLSSMDSGRRRARARAPAPRAPARAPAPGPAPAPRAPARAPARPRLTTRDRANLGVRAQSGAEALRIATKAIQDAARAAGLDPTTALPRPLEVREARRGHYVATGELELVTPGGEPASSRQIADFRRRVDAARNVVVR